MSQLQPNPSVAPFARREDHSVLGQVAEDTSQPPSARLAYNENPLGPSPKVLEAIQREANQLGRYPNFSDLELRRAIAKTLGRGINPDHIYTGCSGFEALELAARAYLGPGDEVIISSPTFEGAYRKVTEPLGVKVVDAPLESGTFRYQTDAVLAALSERSKAIILCNPNNPTGSVVSAARMADLIRGLPPHVLLIADEVYHHFVNDPSYPDSLAYVLEERNIVVIHSFSKAYGMAGLRLGYGIAKPEIAHTIAGLHRGAHQNRLAMAAGIAACEDQEHLRRCVSTLRQEAQWLCAQFDRLDIRYWEPAANFILIETKLLAADMQARLLERGVLLREQSGNGLPACSASQCWFAGGECRIGRGFGVYFGGLLR